MKENFGIVEMTVEVRAIKLLAIVSEDCKYKCDNASSDEWKLHDSVHQRGNVCGEIKSVDGQPQKRSH